MQQAYAAGYVEAHASRGHDTAGVGVECGDPADGEAIAPVRIRHGVNGPDETGQHRDVSQLLVDLVVHLHYLLAVAVQDSRNIHRRLRRDSPREFTVPMESVQVHDSDVHDALPMPLSLIVLVHGERRVGCAFHLYHRFVTVPVHGFAPGCRIEHVAVDRHLPVAE